MSDDGIDGLDDDGIDGLDDADGLNDSDRLDDAVERLHRHLAATAERPVERRASRVLGEAEAVAHDMCDCEPSVAADRAAVVVDLLDEVEATDDGPADDHLESARRLAARLAGR